MKHRIRRARLCPATPRELAASSTRARRARRSVPASLGQVPRILLVDQEHGQPADVWPVVRGARRPRAPGHDRRKEVKSAALAGRARAARRRRPASRCSTSLRRSSRAGAISPARCAAASTTCATSEPRYRDADQAAGPGRAAWRRPPARARPRRRRRSGRAGAARSERRPARDRPLPRCPRRACEAFLAEQRPDVAARPPADRLRLDPGRPRPRGEPARDPRAASRCASWDNLTNKGLLRDAPDLVLVWNELQKARRSSCTACPRERVRVTGAPPYDHWFDWQPAREPRGVLPRRSVSTPPGRSSSTPARRVHRARTSRSSSADGWRRCARTAARCADAGVLVRPHPRRRASSGRTSTSDDPQVAVWPPLGEEPLDDAGRAELLRLDLPRRRRRRDQHERADRGGDRRPAGAHDPRRGVPGDRRRARSTSTTSSTRSSATSTSRARFEEHAQQLERSLGRRRRGGAERALPAPLRPSVRARRRRRHRSPPTRSRSSPPAPDAGRARASRLPLRSSASR